MPGTDGREARLPRLVAAAEPAPGFLTDHEVVLRPAGGRNAAVVVEVDGEPRWVAKAAHAGDASREAAVLRRLAEGPLRGAVPSVRHAGPDGLVTAHAPGMPGDTVPAITAAHLAALGRFLATLHAPACVEEEPPAPWITRIHRPTPRRLSFSSAAVVGLIRDVQADDGMCAALERLATGWRPVALTHGDLRLANVLLRPDGGITVVDWEAAGPGPPALDLGWAAGDLLLRWALAMDPDAPSAALAFRGAGPSLARACGDVARLVAAYGTRGPDLAEILPWAGARLLQAAAEGCQAELFAPARTRTLMLAAGLVLTRTDAVAQRVAAAG